jgi:glycosyltransferase A (GT-A) superfamily protein (DUF2064 family)
MRTALGTVAVIAKEPLPGKVKTRLVGPVTPEDAAELAECALRDTIAALSQIACRHRVVILDGQRGPWLRPGWATVAQSSGSLDERLSAGFDQLPRQPALLVGMDTPQIRAEHLRVDFNAFDACLGLASDGGYWAIGFADPRRARSVISGVQMSRDDTGSQQHRRMIAAGLTVQLLPTLTDVDTPDTADLVARQNPNTAFSHLWRTMMPTVEAGVSR